MGVQVVAQLLADILGTSQEHTAVGLEEQWVIDIGVACSHSSLVNNDVLGVPHFQNWHTSNRAVWVFNGGGIDNIVGTNNQH